MERKQQKKKKKKKLRVISPVFTPALPTRTVTRTRLNPTPIEAEILRLVGTTLSSLEGWALRQRCNTGSNWDKDDAATLKRELTAKGLTSRQAGSIYRLVQAQWRAAREAQKRHTRSLLARIATIETKLSKPIGGHGAYRTKHEHFQKTRRLGVLKGRLNTVGMDTQNADVHIVRGGKKLFKNRQNLEEAKLTPTQWRKAWLAKRHVIEFSGESGKLFGNETLRVDPATGIVELRVPPCLVNQVEAEHPGLLDKGRLRFTKPISFKRLSAEWESEVLASRAVSYRVIRDPKRRSWYIDATFATAEPTLKPLTPRIVVLI